MRVTPGFRIWFSTLRREGRQSNYDRGMAGKKTRGTTTRVKRVEDLCRDIVPAKALKADAPLALKDKKGVEKKYGEFLAKVLGDPVAGTKLCHAMLLPLPGSARKAAEYEK